MCIFITKCREKFTIDDQKEKEKENMLHNDMTC
jgi:hypothetical protein